MIYHFFLFLFFNFLMQGCTSYFQAQNQPQSSDEEVPYSISSVVPHIHNGDYSIVLSFSGGGIRAAALSYGVLQKLNELTAQKAEVKKTLLDEVDFISSVSGGSFTAAYYGLYGKDIFKNYEQEFLKHDVNDELMQRLLSPSLWFTDVTRTYKAIDYYNSALFKDATIKDFYKPNAPLIIINASDLGYGVRFSFIQEYFDLLCSNVNSYPIAQAVAASSAVPVLFNPVVLENHEECSSDKLLSLKTDESKNPITEATLTGLLSYQNKGKRKYIHLVDGGVTDNLGLLALYDIIEVDGGGERYYQKTRAKANPYFIIISVDAATKPESNFESENTEPSIGSTLASMANIQLRRFNAVTKNLLIDAMQHYSEAVSDEDFEVKTYFVDVELDSINDPNLKRYINDIPTSMTIDEKAVDALITLGKRQLENHPEFQRFIKDIQLKSNP